MHNPSPETRTQTRKSFLRQFGVAVVTWITTQLFTKTAGAEGNGQQLGLVSVVIPVGGVIAWWGDAEALPVGFELCDGEPVADPLATLKGKKPNLVDRFPKGSANKRAKKDELKVEGRNYLWDIGKGVTGGHKLSIDEMPKHKHDVKDNGHEHDALRVVGGSGGTTYGIVDRYLDNWNTIKDHCRGAAVISEELKGGDTEHTHPLSDEYRDNQPAYCELIFIIRVR